MIQIGQFGMPRIGRPIRDFRLVQSDVKLQDYNQLHRPDYNSIELFDLEDLSFQDYSQQLHRPDYDPIEVFDMFSKAQLFSDFYEALRFAKEKYPTENEPLVIVLSQSFNLYARSAALKMLELIQQICEKPESSLEERLETVAKLINKQKDITQYLVDPVEYSRSF